MPVGPLNDRPVSLTHHIRFFILRNKAGLNFGKNEVDLANPEVFRTLGQLIGKAGVNLDEYAVFYGLDFTQEYIDLSLPVENRQDIYFVHRSLINLPPHLLIDDQI